MSTILKSCPLVMSLFLTATLYGQIISVDPSRELIVMFKQNTVTPPAGRTWGRVHEFQFSSQDLRQTLLASNGEMLARIIPEFRPEDRFAVSRTGEEVLLTDWTNIYILRLPSQSVRDALLPILANVRQVVYAEPNGTGGLLEFIPNDPHFERQWALKNDGTPLQGNGTPGADIKITQAWDITQGIGSIKIAVIDNGMQVDHEDFMDSTGQLTRVSGDPGGGQEHATFVAGIAAAQGNNGIGIAGVAWNVRIINEDYWPGSDADFAAAIYSADNLGAHAINNSWRLSPPGRYSNTVRLAFADAYKRNRVAVAAMGNEGNEEINHPAGFGQGIIAVGATTNEDARAPYSNTGNWIDVVAPGGYYFDKPGFDPHDQVWSTLPGNSYSYNSHGTSFAAPHVTGLAALLFSYNPSLYNDDVEQLIRVSADDKGSPGFDSEYGMGRINAYESLLRLQQPYILRHDSAIGGSDVQATGWYEMQILGDPVIPDGWYSVRRYEVRKTVTYPKTLSAKVWGRGVATIGWAKGNDWSQSDTTKNFTMGWCEPVPGTVTSTGATLRTYVYWVFSDAGPIGPLWRPAAPSQVKFAYTVFGVTDTPPSSPLAQWTTHLAPLHFGLSENWPNPFNPATTIRYAVPNDGFATLKVFDILGRDVATLVSEHKPAGSYEIFFDATGLPSGVYFYRLQAGKLFAIRKMLLAR